MTALFSKPKVPEPKEQPDEGFELRQRLAGRGGEQSLALSGQRGLTGTGSVFKRKLGSR